MNSHYYISTGAKSNYYALRYTYDETWGNAGETITRDYHVKNLSIDKDEAIAKAREFGPLNIDFDVLPIGTRREIDWSILQGGKFAGQSIHEVRETNPNYLVWLCENSADSRNYVKTVELARALVAKELSERQYDRDAAETARLERAAAWEPIAMIFDREYPQHIQTGHHQWECVGEGRNVFVDNVLVSIRNGVPISEDVANIMVEKVAKLSGRRNSKAFSKAYDELMEITKPIIIQ